MECRRNRPQLSSRHDDDDDDVVTGALDAFSIAQLLASKAKDRELQKE